MKKLSKKNVKLIISLICLCILVIGVYFTYDHIKYTYINNKNVKNYNISIYVEDFYESNTYTKRSSFPLKSELNNEFLTYDIDKEKSYCENNGKVIKYNAETGRVKYNLPGSDECVVYLKITDAGCFEGNLTASNGGTHTIVCGHSTTATYNDATAKFIISNPNYNNKCIETITADTSVTTLSDKIISLAGTTQGTGSVVHEIDSSTDTGYRYEGADPNNYIMFNGERWRIIGTFNGNILGGTTGTYYTKIVRSQSIGGLTFDMSGSSGTYWYNNGTNDTSLGRLLNNYYYTGTNYDSDNGTDCSSTKAPIKGICNYSEKGITDNVYRNMIFNAKWYRKEYTTAGTPKTVYTNDVNTTYPTTAYVGLIYLSDYGYAVLSSSCARTTNLSAYNTAACAGANWLKLGEYEWTMSKYSSNTVWQSTFQGNPANLATTVGRAVRPTIYLKAETYVKSGDGTYATPYVIGIQ